MTIVYKRHSQRHFATINESLHWRAPPTWHFISKNTWFGLKSYGPSTLSIYDWFGASLSRFASYLISWGRNPFLEWLVWLIKKSKQFQFDQSNIASDIATLTQCKRALILSPTLKILIYCSFACEQMCKGVRDVRIKWQSNRFNKIRTLIGLGISGCLYRRYSMLA